MPQVTIRPAPSSNIGAIRCSSATYATARSGGGSFTSFTASSASAPGGQRLFSGTYDLNEQFFEFTPAAAVPGAVVTSAEFEWTTFSSNVSGGDQQAILEYAAGAITTADWQDGTELAALPVWGSVPGTGYQSNSTTYQVSLNSTAIASIQASLRAGTAIGFMMVAQAQIDNTAPSGNDRYDIRSDDDATEALRPGLIITYSLIGDGLTAGSRLSRMRPIG